MGKNLRQQRRGKGLPRYRSRSHRYIGKLKYPAAVIVPGAAASQGKVVDFVHSTGKKTPVAIVEIAGKKELMLPAEGMSTDQIVEFMGTTVTTGNVLELAKIPEGTKIFNIELRPGDGGKLCRAPGTAALILTKNPNSCVVVMPSKKQITLDAHCRATIGVPAGAGRGEKPFVKAGKKHHAARAIGKIWPIVSGVAKNPVDHPHGGKTKPGGPITVSRHAPPGAKVGSIAARRTGKKKR